MACGCKSCASLYSSGEGGGVLVETWFVVRGNRIDIQSVHTDIWAQGALWVLIRS